ncbi:hypothetical protein [Natronomonas salsuginis]|nr:hypothetical protein [Natronomonas salsuginis]
MNDDLLPDDTVTCRTSGSVVEAEQIETTAEKHQKVSKDTVREI